MMNRITTELPHLGLAARLLSGTFGICEAFALSDNNLAPAGNQAKPISGVGTTTLKGAPSLWTYVTADSQATVNTAAYFNEASALLRVGDMIHALCGAGSGGTLAPVVFTVLSNASGVVDVSDGVATVISDAD